MRSAPSFIMRRITRYDAQPLVEAFHYSKKLPEATHNFGAFHPVTGELLAVACYSVCILNAARPGKPRREGWLELRRLVRRPGAVLILSQFLSSSLRALKHEGVPAVLSYADPEQDHHGGIYQATNWIATKSSPQGNSNWIIPTGEELHNRTVSARYGTSDRKRILAIHPDWIPRRPKGKIRYLMPLCLRPKRALAALQTVARSYPKPLL